jgi:hypothetical protein
MRNLFTILLVALLAFSSQAEICQITLTGDWTNSSLRIVEPNSGVDTTITATSQVYFRGTGNATFLYLGVDGVNTFEYNNCSGYDFTSPILTNQDIYISAGVLPVELTYFRAELENNAAVLTFETSSEENNSHFEVQKAVDGKDFETIGIVNGNGTTLEVQEYSFVDSELENGTNYYRLKQFDFDGQFEYSDIVSIDYEFEKLNFGNVVTNEIQFRETVNEVLLYDTNGRLLKQVNQVDRVDVSNLKIGVYFLKINKDNYRIVKTQ